MAKVLFSDNAATTATSTITNGGMSITLSSSAKFPVPTGSDYFYATLYQKPAATEINIEIVKVTANNTGTNTLTLSQRDVTNIGVSGGYAYNTGVSGPVYVELRWIASDANLLMQAADLTAANVANTPAGGISATTVQAALNGLDTAKANLASANFTVLQVGGVAVPTATDISTAITTERSATRTLTNATLDSSSGKIGSLTGILKATSGAPSAATAGVDYTAGTSALATGILKNTTTTGAHSIAVAGTDYQAPIGTISGIAKGNGANALIAATAGTDYAPATSGSAILRGNGAGGFTPASAGSDYVSPSGAETLSNKTLTNPVINGHTGDTSAINIGSGQIIKDTNGNFGIGGTPLSAANYKFVTVVGGSTGGGYSLNNSGGSEVGRFFTDGTQIGFWNTSATLPTTFVMNSTERFRFGTSGQLGVSGTNYGSAGQALLSGGPSAPPTWGTVPSGANSGAITTPANPSGGFAMYSVAHGLGVVPAESWVEITCTTAEYGWGVGTVITNPFLYNGVSGYVPATIAKDATNGYLPVPNGFALGIIRADTGNATLITTANWSTKIVFRKT